MQEDSVLKLQLNKLELSALRSKDISGPFFVVVELCAVSLFCIHWLNFAHFSMALVLVLVAVTEASRRCSALRFCSLRRDQIRAASWVKQR